MATVAEIREALADSMGEIDGLKRAYPYEQEDHKSLPSCDITFLPPTQAIVSTQFYTLGLRFALNFYANDRQFHKAQEQLDEVVMGALARLRADPDLKGLVDRVILEDGTGPERETEGSPNRLVMSLFVLVETEEG